MRNYFKNFVYIRPHQFRVKPNNVLPVRHDLERRNSKFVSLVKAFLSDRVYFYIKIHRAPSTNKIRLWLNTLQFCSELCYSNFYRFHIL